jgi:hypothetical protein
MYIPSSFFSSQGACISSSVTYVTGSGGITSGSFVSASITWSYIQFVNTIDPVSNSSSFEATLNITSGSTGQAKLFLVAGGGAGGYGGCVPAPVSCNSTAAGGGGGGGIVYYNEFPLSVGSYNISVGAGGGNPLNGGIPGRQGANTTFTYNIPYTPFTSSVITAYGGGKGGYITNDGYGGTDFVAGASGGSAGGTVVCSNGDGANQIIQACCDGLGGLNNANQGNDALGGIAGSSNYQGTGGGGAGTPGAQTNGVGGPLVSVGGDGASYNLTGTTLTYAAGGGGARGQGFPVVQAKANDGSGTAGFGNGGQGQTLSYDQGTTATNGTVIIAWPVCLYPTPPRNIPFISGSFPASPSVIYDFGNIISYPTTGSIVYDLSGNNNHGNLTGLTLPAYSASNGGIIRLDSSQLQNVDYSGSFTPNATVVTIWKNFNSTFLVDSGLPDAAMAYGIKAATIGGTKQYTPILYNNVGTSNTFSSATSTPNNIDVWHQYATVVNSSGPTSTATTYLDEFAIAAQSKSFNRSGTSGSGSVFIGKDRAVAGRYSNGYLMGYLQYNRDLTSIELNQIYTTFSSRF